MKKSVKIFCVASAAISLLVSCQKESPEKSLQPSDGVIELTINATLPEFDEVLTKGYAENNYRIYWEDADIVYVYDNTICLGTLTATPKDNTRREATLSGTISSSEASKLTLVTSSFEPSVKTQDASITEGLTFNFSTQQKDGLKAGYVLYATIDNPTGTESSLEAPFYFASSVVKISCAGLQPGEAINNAKINGVNTTLTLTPKADEVPVVSGSNDGTITVTNLGNARQDGTVIFMAAILPQDKNARTVSVNQDKWPATSAFADEKIEKGSSYSTVYQLNGPYKTVAGHTGVRLWDGGPYWATTNIGAESPTDRGLYFMWGYIQGYKWDGSKFVNPDTGDDIPTSGFSWKNYTKFGTFDGSNFTASKYTASDGKNQLDPEDDAANILWGGGWRMPTAKNEDETDDFSKLCNNCNHTYISEIPGVLFTGKDAYAGLSVFFPIARKGIGTNESEINEAHYWSKNVHNSDNNWALGLTIQSGNTYPDYYEKRYYGCFIRPVID